MKKVISKILWGLVWICLGFFLCQVWLETFVPQMVEASQAPSWRADIKKGDILYDKNAIYSGILGNLAIGHTGIYAGDIEIKGETFKNQVIEAQTDGVNNNNITSWDNPQRNNVYLLRLKECYGGRGMMGGCYSPSQLSQIKQGAVDFAISQRLPTPKPYDFHWWQKDLSPDAPSWYCSELV